MQEGGSRVEEPRRILLGQTIADVVRSFLGGAAQLEACFAPLPDGFNRVLEKGLRPFKPAAIPSALQNSD